MCSSSSVGRHMLTPHKCAIHKQIGTEKSVLEAHNSRRNEYCMSTWHAVQDKALMCSVSTTCKADFVAGKVPFQLLYLSTASNSCWQIMTVTCKCQPSEPAQHVSTACKARFNEGNLLLSASPPQHAQQGMAGKARQSNAVPAQHASTAGKAHRNEGNLLCQLVYFTLDLFNILEQAGKA